MRMLSQMFKRAFQWRYNRWQKNGQVEDGYSILVPSPMDMPFLLRFTLESLRFLDTTDCRQIIVVPDGWSNDGGAQLRAVTDEFNDPRLVLLNMGLVDRMVVRALEPHWLTIVYGIDRSRTRYAFLHDADSFFIDADGIQRIYQTAIDRKLDTLGVTARSDPFFSKIGYRIPGTWEMIFSCEWARKWKPFSVRGGTHETPHGTYAFDTFLYPQYHDYNSGRIGVMDNPPALVHFNGTIMTFRAWRRAQDKRQPVTDELYRVLLISLMEELTPSENGSRVSPPIHTLVQGLSNPNALTRYSKKKRAYLLFREKLDQLCLSPIFANERRERMMELIKPFDDFYANQPLEAEDETSRFRVNGLS